MLINFIVILVVSLMPVFLFRKSAKETILIALSVVLFLLFYRRFFFGLEMSYHDTFWGVEPYFHIMRQWISYGHYPGWNPYMNGGEPVYIFSNFFLHMPFLFFCILGQLVSISTNILFNQCWIFMYLIFCIGSFLLFCELYGDFKVAFFCFTALLLSGCFDINLGQPVSLVILYLFPYILFGLITSLRNKTSYGIAFAIVYLGLSLNHYNPLYILLITLFFGVTLLLFKISYIKIIYTIVCKKYKLILLAIFLAVFAAGPMIAFKSEIKNFVCPTRGSLTEGGGITVDQSGTQPRVNAYLSGYKILLERMLLDKYGGIHHAFYFGIIPLILIVIALFKSKDKIVWAFFAAAVFAALVGTGKGFILVSLYALVPGFGMLRHPCWFAPFVSFFLICISGFGLKEILSKRNNNGVKIIFISAIFSIGLVLVTKDKYTIILILESLFAIVASVLLIKVVVDRIKVIRLAYIWIFIIFALDLCLFNTKFLMYSYYTLPGIQYRNFGLYPPEDIGDPYPIKYPLERTFYGDRSSPISLNLFPLFFKEASLNSPREDLVLFRNSRLHDMLGQFKPSAGYEPALGVDVPLIYFSNNVVVFPHGFKKEVVIGEIYENASRQELSKYSMVYFQKEDIDFDIPNKDDRDFVYLPIRKLEEADNPNRISMFINAPVDGFLVRLENFHRGWNASVDGIPAKIYRANYAFQAIKLSKGSHKVVFEFETIYTILFWSYILISALLWVLLNFYLYKYEIKDKILPSV